LDASKIAAKPEEKKPEAAPSSSRIDIEPALRLAFKSAPDQDQQMALKNILASHPGNNPVYFRISQGKLDNVLKIAATVDNTSALRQELRQALGNGVQVVEPEND